MTGPKRKYLAMGLLLVLTAMVVSLTPVTIRPASILPRPLLNLLPPAATTAELSCGSVANPGKSPGFDGLFATVASVVKTDCTRAVRRRMWYVVWLFIGGIAVLLLGVSRPTFRTPRTDRRDENAPPP